MKIKIEDIQATLNEQNWKLISTEYKNQDEELIFECPHGHRVFDSWKKMRKIPKCPVCETNTYANVSQKPVMKHKGVNRILALDQATKVTGWSIYDNDKLISYGIFETNLTDEIERCNQIREWLISMIAKWSPSLVGIEDIQFQEEGGGQRMGVTVFKTLAHLQGILMETCYEQKVDYKLCPTNTWRHICGVKGKSRSDKKRSMQLQAKAWYDIQVSEDEADAIGIGKYLASTTIVNLVVENWE